MSSAQLLVRNDVKLEKIVEANDGISVTYDIESASKEARWIQLTDELPSSLTPEDIHVWPIGEARYWTVADSVAIFARRLDPSATVRTTLTLSEGAIPRDTMNGQPTLIAVADRRELAPVGTTAGGGNGRIPRPELGLDLRFPDRRIQPNKIRPGFGSQQGRTAGTPPGPREQGYASPSGSNIEERFAPPETDGGVAHSTLGNGTVLAGIPAYNESETVADIVDGAKPYVDDVVVVDDGSDDTTSLEAARSGASVITHRRNLGYGASLKSIFREADRRGASMVVVLDADGQHDPDDITKLIDRHRTTGAELIIGSRFADGSRTQLPLYRHMGIFLINLLTNLSMGVVRPKSYVRDTQSGFRLYGDVAITELARSHHIGDNMGASIDILHVSHQRNYHIEEVGVRMNYDVAAANSHNPVVHGYLLVKNVFRTVERERPLLSLGFPGILASVGGIGLVLLTITEFELTGRLPMQSIMLALFLTLVGLFSCFAAILIHAFNQQPRI